MTAAINIPENYAEELPKTIAELQAQQEYFNQLEIAAKQIQEATKKYNELLEQGLTAIPANNTDYNPNDTEIESNYQENQYKEEPEEATEQNYEEEEELNGTDEYNQTNNEELNEEQDYQQDEQQDEEKSQKENDDETKTESQ
jgi:hypothetical protein